MAIEIQFNGEWKSLKPFQWGNIPKLAILTGGNGVGKTQLINLLRDSIRLEDKLWKNLYGSCLRPVISGLKLSPYDIGFWGAAGSPFPNENQEFHYLDIKYLAWEMYFRIKPERRPQEFGFPGATGGHPMQRQRSKYQNLLSKNGYLERVITEVENKAKKSREDLTITELAFYFPEERLLDELDILTQDRIDIIFYMHSFKKVISKQLGISASTLGEAPWTILNKVIDAANLPYQLNIPDVHNIEKVTSSSLEEASSTPFKVKLIDPQTKEHIGFSNLSSGEKIIMSVALALYYSQSRNLKRDLFVMDEPDAHLHPKMKKQFFDTIYQVLIKDFNSHVIMTTHSPSTIALAPNETDVGFFEMKKKPTRIEPISRESAISALTVGLLTIGPSTQFVLIEGKDDQAFYEAAFRILRNKKILPDERQLVFISGTGKDSVHHWSKGLNNAGLSDSIHGIIDHDNNNQPSERVRVLGRYSIENYLLDPLILAMTLINSKLDIGKNLCTAFNIFPGEETKLLALDNKVVNEMTKEVLQQAFPSRTQNDISLVKYINGMELSIPNWILRDKGKTLLVEAQETISHKIINRQMLIQTMSRLYHLPKEFADLIETIK